MSIKKDVIPEWQQVIDFDGDALTIVMVASVVYVALKPIVDILGPTGVVNIDAQCAM